MLKNIYQKLAGKNRIHIDSGTLIFTETDILFNYDQSSGPHLSHIKACLYQLIDGLIRKSLLYFLPGIQWKNRCHNLLLPQLLQHFTQFRLKNNNYAGKKYGR